MNTGWAGSRAIEPRDESIVQHTVRLRCDMTRRKTRLYLKLRIVLTSPLHDQHENE